MSVEQIVEQIARLDDVKMAQLAQVAMNKGVAVPLEFALHTAQLDADWENDNAV